MPIVNRIAAMQGEVSAWRHDIHAHPELLYDVHRTAGSVADKLKSFGCDEVVSGIGRTGVVGVIRGRKAGGKVVGMRADMDALPLKKRPACLTNRRFRAKCMPAAMTAIWPCCWAPRNISPRHEI